jgi:5-methylcytosine-specific restriction endonuclease McrA
MPARQLVTNEEVIAAYQETGSAWKAAKKLGICGQSVWERLKRMGYSLPSSEWTEEEISTLRELAGTMPLAELAAKLCRPDGSGAGRLSALGISGRCKPPAVNLRGTGLTKDAVRGLVKDLGVFKGKLTNFCRQRGMKVDLFVKAVQQHAPEFWSEYSKTFGLPESRCEYCNGAFYPLTKKQRTCSRKCQAHARSNKKYFNGQRRNTIGLDDGVCQVCLRQTAALSSHHVYGKENDPDADFLLAVCNGCHDLIGQLGSMKRVNDAAFYERLIIFANMRRNGAERPAGYHVHVEIEQLTEEETSDAAW